MAINSITLQEKIAKALENSLDVPVTMKWGEFGRNFPYVIVDHGFDFAHPSEESQEKELKEISEIERKAELLEDEEKKKKVKGMTGWLKECASDRGKSSFFQIEVWTNTKEERDKVGNQVVEILSSLDLGSEVIKAEITRDDNFGDGRRSIDFEVNYEHELTPEEKGAEIEFENEEDLKYKCEEVVGVDLFIDATQSKNQKFAVAFNDGYEDSTNKTVKFMPGEVYLIEGMNKVLWKKNIDRPNATFVTDKGDVIVIDWVDFGKSNKSKLHVFDKEGKKLFEYQFNSNIKDQKLSSDGKKLTIEVGYPEEAEYYFDIDSKKIIKK